MFHPRRARNTVRLRWTRLCARSSGLGRRAAAGPRIRPAVPAGRSHTAADPEKLSGLPVARRTRVAERCHADSEPAEVRGVRRYGHAPRCWRAAGQEPSGRRAADPTSLPPDPLARRYGRNLAALCHTALLPRGGARFGRELGRGDRSRRAAHSPIPAAGTSRSAVPEAPPAVWTTLRYVRLTHHGVDGFDGGRVGPRAQGLEHVPARPRAREELRDHHGGAAVAGEQHTHGHVFGHDDVESEVRQEHRADRHVVAVVVDPAPVRGCFISCLSRRLRRVWCTARALCVLTA